MVSRHPFCIELLRVLEDKKIPLDEKLKQVNLILKSIQAIKDARKASKLQEIALFEKLQKDIPDAKLTIPMADFPENKDLDINFTVEHSDFTPLTAATASGNRAIVDELLKAGASYDFADKKGHTPLIRASANAHGEKVHDEIVKVLLDAKADPNQKNEISGTTPLINAESLSTIQLLLAAKANFHYENEISGGTVLTSTITLGEKYIEMLKFLLAEKADPNHVSKKGHSPLGIAANKGILKAVNILIEAKADPNLAVNNSLYFAPLDRAAARGHSSVVSALIKAKADPNKLKMTLTLACSNGHASTVVALVDANADPNKSNVFGDTPLMIASSGGHVDVVTTLLKINVDINARNNLKQGVTALMHAANFDHSNVILKLIEQKADPDLMADNGGSALDIAVNQKKLNAIGALLSRRATIHHPKQFFDYLKSEDSRNPAMLECLKELVRQQEAIRKEQSRDRKSSSKLDNLLDDKSFILAKLLWHKLTILHDLYNAIIATEVKEGIDTGYTPNEKFPFFSAGVKQIALNYATDIKDFITQPLGLDTQKIDEQIKALETIMQKLSPNVMKTKSK